MIGVGSSPSGLWPNKQVSGTRRPALAMASFGKAGRWQGSGGHRADPSTRSARSGQAGPRANGVIMPTGACGINCDVCKLQLRGVCSSCDHGCSEQAKRKLEAQERIIGGTCSILACAVMNQVAYCSRDCFEFPCENFSRGPYPFSQGYLDMQLRRMRDLPPALDHNNQPVEVPAEFWDELEHLDLQRLCNVTLAIPLDNRFIEFRFLHENIRVDISQRQFYRNFQGQCIPAEDPLLELITLLYFNTVDALYPLGTEIVGTKDLKERYYFSGNHELPLNALLECYGDAPERFRRAAEYLDGEPMDMADVAYRLLPFPRVPLYYLIWAGDDEFEPNVSVLFDRSIENCFSASGIWALVKRVSMDLLRGPERALGSETVSAKT